MRDLFDFDAAESLPAAWDLEKRIVEQNRLREAVFEEDVMRAGWRRLRPGDSLNLHQGNRIIVIGAVLWNPLDRMVLKEAAKLSSAHENVAVFNLDEVHSATQLAAFVPGVPIPTQTPIVAEYEAGELRRFGLAEDARALLSTCGDACIG